MHTAKTPTVFKTVLGSCVAVCLWDERLRIGGINHYLLPSARGVEIDPRFGDVAIPRLIDRMTALGCCDLVAKVFGGATVMVPGGVACVGNVNTEIALTLLRERRIPVVAQRTGGAQGIVIQYWTHSGEVRVRDIIHHDFGAEASA